MVKETTGIKTLLQGVLAEDGYNVRRVKGGKSAARRAGRLWPGVSWLGSHACSVQHLYTDLTGSWRSPVSRGDCGNRLHRQPETLLTKIMLHGEISGISP